MRFGLLLTLPQTMRLLSVVAVLACFWPSPASGNITVSTTTNGTQVDGYFNSTNSISVTVTLDDISTNDLTTYGNGGIYLEYAWAESGTPSSFSILSPPATVAFSSGTATITATKSNIDATNTQPEGDNLDLKVVIIDAIVNPTTSTTKDVTFEGSNAYVQYDATAPWLSSFSYPGSDFNTMQVIYTLNEDLSASASFKSSVTFTGTAGTDDGTSHVYEFNQASNEIQSGASRTVSLSGQMSNGDLIDGSTYSVSFYLVDDAGNTRTDIWYSRAFDSTAPTITGVSTSASDGTYKIGDVISFTVSFSEAVTASGSMQTTFETGSTDETITTTSGNISNASSVNDSYTVQEGDTTNDLSVSSISMLSGSLDDAASNSLSDFSIPAGQNISDSKNIVIDGIRPTITSVTSSSTNGSYSTGEQINVTVNFSESVSLSASENLIVTLETGTTDQTVTIPASEISSVSTVSGTYTVQSGDETSDLKALSVTRSGGSVTDAAGNAITNFSIPAGQNISDLKDIVVETTAPTIGSVASSTSDGSYGIGSDISLTVNFVNGSGGAAEAVTLTGGDLVLTLETGTTDRTVTISSISSATSATGTYTVQEGDSSADLAVSSIDLSGGATLKDAAGNSMSVFTIPAGANVNNSSDLVIEATRPTISSVSSTTNDGTYNIGDAINITVTFSEAVTLSSGNLDVLLETGTTDRTVNISPFSNSNSASATYTVQEGDSSLDLSVTSISLGTGASLKDVVTNNPNAMSNFGIPSLNNLNDSKAIVVDGIRPTIASITTSSANGYYNIGDTVNIKVNFSEAVTLSGGNLIVTLETGTTDEQVTISNISAASVGQGTYTVQSGDVSSDLSVSSIALSGGSLSDAAGNSLSDFTIPSGKNIDDAYGIVVDGVVPTDFTITSVSPSGGTEVDGYWNGTNTGLSVIVPLDNSDASLEGGTVQLQGKVDANSYVDLGALSAITGSELSSGSKTVTVSASGTGDKDVEELTGFGDGGVISVRAIITDVAGNRTTGSANSSEDLTIEETAPTVSSITSNSDNGTYKLADDINISITFSEPVTLSGGNLNATLDAGTIVKISSITSSSTASGTYTVAAGDESSDLTVNTLSVDAGESLSDAAGNPVSDFTVPTGQNIADSKAIVVDGIVPADFTVGSVTTVTEPVVAGYWNSNNTAIHVIIPVANDASLVDGTVQVQGKVNVNNYVDIGSAYTITSGDLNSNVTITVSGTGTAGTDLEELTDFSLSSATVYITAAITDKAGNETTGTASSTTLTIDQTAPTAQQVSTVLPTGGTVVSGYWNSTNSGMSVVVPLVGSDATLENGTILLQAEADGTFENLGEPFTISDADLSAGSKTVTADSSGYASDSTGVEELSGFGDGDILSFKAVVTDAAGNSTTFTQSDSTLTVDQSVPGVTNVTSSDLDAYYNIGDSITITITADEAITVTGTPQLKLETGSTDAVVDYSSGSGTTSLDFSYAVSSGDTSSDLNYWSTSALASNGGTMRDNAGNDLDLTLPALAGANSLASNKNIKVDGVVPADFTVGGIATKGGNIVSGYWNSTNTSITVVVPLDSNDPSLASGTIQLQAEADGTFEDLGGSVAIVGDSVTAGSQTVSIQATGTDDTDLEDLSGFSDGDEITIKAIITDIAGNSTTGSVSTTTLTVDQTVPTVQTVGAVTATGGTVIAGYWNSTNTGVSVVVPLESSDASLENGTILLQAEADGTYENLGEPATISGQNLTQSSRTITAQATGTDSTDIEELSGFGDEDILSFRAVVTDLAGNSSTFSVSDSTLIVDQTIPTITGVTSTNDNGYFKAGDTVVVRIQASEAILVDTTAGIPLLALETGTFDATARYYAGSGGSNLDFRYLVAENQNTEDLDYVDTTSLSLNGAVLRDLAGNELVTTLPAPGGTGSLGNNKNLVIDTTPASVTFTYENITQTNLVNTGKADDVVRITADFSEKAKNSPAPTLNVVYGDSTNDSFADLATTGSSNNDSTWTFQFSIPDSSANDGPMKVTVTARDLSGNLVTTFVDSQKFVVDNTPPDTFTTKLLTEMGSFVVEGWINSTTDSISINVPISASDESLLLGGEVDIEMNIPLRMGSTWTTVGSADSIEQAGSLSFFRTVPEIVTALTPHGFAQGDRILTRAVISDRVGNSRKGTESADTLAYDPNRPDTSSVVLWDTLIVSNDTLSITWKSFKEPTPETASGIERYEWALEEVGSGAINNFRDWTSVSLDTSALAVVPLRHNNYYRAHVRAWDVAGNLSEMLSSDSTRRLNSPPIFASTDSQVVKEDVLFTYQIRATDVDTSTLLGDTLHYTILDTGITGAANKMSIDEFSGLVTWNTPLQPDTGIFTVVLRVADEWLIPGGTSNYADTTNFVLTVRAVNDTPVVGQIPDVQFLEDVLVSDTLNLTQYVDDVDDNDSTGIRWSVEIKPDNKTYPSYPRLIFQPGTSSRIRRAVRNSVYTGRTRMRPRKRLLAKAEDTKLNVVWDTSGVLTKIIFKADSNYYVQNRQVVIRATDDSLATDSTAISITITPINDPPKITAMTDTTMWENDTLILSLRAQDIDDSTVTFRVIPDSSRIAVTVKDSLATFIPEKLWSRKSRILVIVSDEEFSDSTSFLLDILRVTRPHLSMSLAENATFSRFFQLMVTDTAEKTISLTVTLRPQGIEVPMKSVSSYTWVASHEFDTTGTFYFDMYGLAKVGDTTITRSAELALARANRSWRASSPDGVFRVAGEAGSVQFDKPFSIVDSLLFPLGQRDGGLYRMGHSLLTFEKPVLVSLPVDDSLLEEEQAIYQKSRSGIWREIPTVTQDGSLLAWTSEMGYFKLGKRTIIVPEKTALGMNYPNPFNAETHVVFDVGFFGGPDQRVDVSVYNILGQHVKTLHRGPMGIGRHELVWRGTDKRGTSVASGIYLVRLATDSGTLQSKKMMLLR